MNIRVFSLTLLALLGCSTPSSNTEANLSNSCDWSHEKFKDEPQQPPYWFELEGKSGFVFFIAAEHGEEKENQETFNLIRVALKNKRPERVIIESLETIEGISPQTYLDDIRDGHRMLGEPAFLATEAKRLGIEFLGGEVSDKELLTYLEGKGFSQKDMAGFYIVRAWEHGDAPLGRIVKSKRFPINGQFENEEAFQKWFKDKTNEEFGQDKKKRWTRPFAGRKDLLQILANEITWARDRHLANTILKSYEEKSKILVVYGAGHAGPQKCFLSATVGTNYKTGKTL